MTSVDIIFRRVSLEGTDTISDIAVQDGIIIAVGNNLEFTAPEGHDIVCDGMLVTPPFIDAHQHLDCAYMLDEENRTGTLQEAVEIFTRIKPVRTEQTVKELAERAVLDALYNGTCFIRSQVDVDSIAGMKHLQPILELRQAYRGIVDIQVVACMEYSLAQQPQAESYLRAAVEAGADLVGSIPEVEPSPAAQQKHIQMIFDIARSYNVDIDMHIDETADPRCRTLEMLADTTIRENYHGRVTAGHCCALAAYDDQYASQVIDKVAMAGIHVITNPLTNLYIQGRGPKTPVWRGITRVRELDEAGVNVSCGLDDLRNLFLPFGRMNMLEVALFTSLTAQMTTPKYLQYVFDMPRYKAAKIVGLRNYGIQTGNQADFVILPVDSILDAIRLSPAPRYIVRAGKIIAENRVERSLHI